MADKSVTAHSKDEGLEAAVAAAQRIIDAAKLYNDAHKIEGGFRFPCEPTEEELNYEAVIRGDSVSVAEALLSSSAAERGMREACQAMLDDHMTSETHHPGYVLVPTAAFEKAREVIAKAIP